MSILHKARVQALSAFLGLNLDEQVRSISFFESLDGGVVESPPTGTEGF